MHTIFGLWVRQSKDWSIAVYLFAGVKRMLPLCIPGARRAADLPQLTTSPPNIPDTIRRRAHSVQWHRSVCIVSNEISMVPWEPQEASDVLTIVRFRPIDYYTGYMLLGVNAIILNISATKLFILTIPHKCCMFSHETVFLQQCRHISEIVPYVPPGYRFET